MGNFKLVLIFALAVFAQSAFAEEVTVTTYYPSPEGKYKKLETTDETLLATDTTSETAKVGIGTTTPQATLDVNGDLSVSGTITVNGKKGAGLYVSVKESVINKCQPLAPATLATYNWKSFEGYAHINCGCHRYCSYGNGAACPGLGYSGGQVSEVDGSTDSVGCICS